MGRSLEGLWDSPSDRALSDQAEIDSPTSSRCSSTLSLLTTLGFGIGIDEKREEHDYEVVVTNLAGDEILRYPVSSTSKRDLRDLRETLKRDGDFKLPEFADLHLVLNDEVLGETGPLPEPSGDDDGVVEIHAIVHDIAVRKSFDDGDELRAAVQKWCSGGESRKMTGRKYGHIEDWDVKNVRCMFGLFSKI